MRVLLVKTSSMGDVIHTLPALSDAQALLPDVQFDWMVEEAFQDIPAWHPAVRRVIPVALRQWRKRLWYADTWRAFRALQKELHAEHYDVVLDAQGLVKSALVSLAAKGTRAGLDFRSAREALASFAYQKKYTVNFYQHAVVRMRSLFSKALGYALSETPPDFGLAHLRSERAISDEKYLVFLHATAWTSKQWPETYWRDLAMLVAKQGYRVKISGGNAVELERAQRIAKDLETVDALPRLTIQQMATLLAQSQGAVGVDTGFGHLAAALDIPTVIIYGATNPAWTSATGARTVNVSASFACAPCSKRICTYRGASTVQPACYETMTPERVWGTLAQALS